MKTIYCYIYPDFADFEVTILVHRLRNAGGYKIVTLAETEEPLPEFDWYRITSYSDEKVEIYYINGDVGGKITCRKTANGWTHTDIVDSIMWSGSGSADEYVWPYWYHIFLT